MPLTQDECLDYLEEVLWKGVPRCPYCQSTKVTPYRKERRYHCNHCFTSFSVTVGTLFQKTHIDLRKWFFAIALVSKSKKKVTTRQLAKRINVNKNTAARILKEINKEMSREPSLINNIAQLNLAKRVDIF